MDETFEEMLHNNVLSDVITFYRTAIPNGRPKKFRIERGMFVEGFPDNQDEFQERTI